MTALNVLIGLTYYWPNISGVTMYAVILAEELVKRKHKVKVICGGRDGERNGVIIYGVKGCRLGKGYIMPNYWWKSMVEVRKCQIVNCHLPAIESFWLALWAKIFGKKLIVTHHCEFGISGPWQNVMIGILTYPIHLVAYMLADKIISYTQDYADTSIFLKFFRNKLVYVLPPIKINRNKIQDSRFRNKTVGFVGRIAWEKGLDILIEAMKKVDAKLMLVGPYKNVVGDNTYQKLKDVEFVGPIDHDKLSNYYQRLDCLVLPSTNNLETFGIVQAEAMVCGCPVVATNLPGVRVPVRMTGMGEIAEIGDAKDLAIKINLVLKRGKKYYQKKAKNVDKFDYLKTVNQYEKILKTD